MRFLPSSFIAALAVSIAATSGLYGQNLSIGIMVGGSTTNGFQSGTAPGGVRYSSTSKDYLIGPTLEWSFSPRWSVEVDGLFRELHFAVEGTNADGAPGSANPDPVVTWEFPVLAKYRLTTSGPRPFVEAGASFRTAGNLNGTNPSHAGFTAGTGVEMRLGKLTFAPVLRYTRWRQDTDASPVADAKSRADQLELAVGVNTSPERDSHPLGRRVSLGALVGTGLTDDIQTSGFAVSSGIQAFSETTYPRRGVIGGVMVQVGLPANFCLESDAIYDPQRSRIVTSNGGMNSITSATSVGDWEVPVLAKRVFRTSLVRPFVEAGPAFRIGNGEVSHYGVTAGAGFETRFRALRIAPTLRYSHWAADTLREGSGSVSNQVELFGAFYF